MKMSQTVAAKGTTVNYMVNSPSVHRKSDVCAGDRFPTMLKAGRWFHPYGTVQCKVTIYSSGPLESNIFHKIVRPATF